MSDIHFSPRLWAAAGVSVAAAAVSGSAVAAMADATLSSNFASPQVFFELAPDETEVSAPPVSVSVSRFNPGLGTLTGISLTFNDGFDYSASASIPVAGCSDISETGGGCSYNLSAALSMSGLMATPEGSGTAGYDLSAATTETRTTPSFAGTRTLNPSPSGPATPLGLPAGFGTILAPYVGSGTWELLFSIAIDGVEAQSECTATGSYACQGGAVQTGTVSGDALWNVYNIAVTYTYDPAGKVPAPSSLALFSVALAGLGMAGLRRRRRPA